MQANNAPTAPRTPADRVFFLSRIIGARVMLRGKKVGTLSDLVIMETGKIPEVRQVVVARPFGKPPLVIPWERVSSMEDREMVVDLGDVKDFEGEPAENAVLLRDHILDKKVLDMEDKEVNAVYDIKLVLRNGALYVTDVDFGRYGLLKRLHLKPIIKLLFGDSDLMKKDMLSWTYVQRLPENIHRFGGRAKLDVLKEKLPEIHPVDLADILEEMNEEHRLPIFNQLETGLAAATLEEIEPRVQKSLISSIFSWYAARETSRLAIRLATFPMMYPYMPTPKIITTIV